jgi:hypothetical protein
MGLCRYCGTEVGLFKGAHQECAQRANEARDFVTRQTLAAVAGEISVTALTGYLRDAQSHLADKDLTSQLLYKVDKQALQLALDSPVSTEDAERIYEVYKAIDPNWSGKDVAKWDGWLALAHSNVLFDILHGRVPYYEPGSFRDFRLRSGEHPIVRRFAQLAEYRTVPSGSLYQSLSIPIGRGIYYRLGSSHPAIPRTGLAVVDEGITLISTEAFYFGGQQATLRIEHGSILRLEPFMNGFIIHENYGRPKAIVPATIGKLDEGWYFYNLMQALGSWTPQ